MPGEEEIALDSGGPGIIRGANNGEGMGAGMVMTARPRLSVHVGSLRPQTSWGSFSRDLCWSEQGLTSRLQQKHHGENSGTFR